MNDLLAVSQTPKSDQKLTVDEAKAKVEASIENALSLRGVFSFSLESAGDLPGANEVAAIAKTNSEMMSDAIYASAEDYGKTLAQSRGQLLGRDDEILSLLEELDFMKNTGLFKPSAEALNKPFAELEDKISKKVMVVTELDRLITTGTGLSVDEVRGKIEEKKIAVKALGELREELASLNEARAENEAKDVDGQSSLKLALTRSSVLITRMEGAGYVGDAAPSILEDLSSEIDTITKESSAALRDQLMKQHSTFMADGDLESAGKVLEVLKVLQGRGLLEVPKAAGALDTGVTVYQDTHSIISYRELLESNPARAEELYNMYCESGLVDEFESLFEAESREGRVEEARAYYKTQVESGKDDILFIVGTRENDEEVMIGGFHKSIALEDGVDGIGPVAWLAMDWLNKDLADEVAAAHGLPTGALYEGDPIARDYINQCREKGMALIVTEGDDDSLERDTERGFFPITNSQGESITYLQPLGTEDLDADPNLDGVSDYELRVNMLNGETSLSKDQTEALLTAMATRGFAPEDEEKQVIFIWHCEHVAKEMVSALTDEEYTVQRPV